MGILWILTGLTCVVVLSFISWWSKHKNHFKELGIPYFVESPVKQFINIFYPKRSFHEASVDIYNRFSEERFCGYFQFLEPCLMIRDPELINTILIKDFNYFEDRGKSFENSGLISLSVFGLSGERWREVRHKLVPAFTSGKLKFMFSLLKQCSDELLYYLENNHSQDIDTKSLMRECVFSMIAKVALGLNVELLKQKDRNSHEFIRQWLNFFRSFPLPMVKLSLNAMFPKIFKFNPLGNKMETYFLNLISNVIMEREKSKCRRNDFIQIMLDEREKQKNCLDNGVQKDAPSNDFDNHEDKELTDNLKIIKRDNNATQYFEKYTDSFIAAQSFIFISGGSESTSAVITFTLYELAVNKDVQTRVSNEINEILSTYGFTYEGISKMSYLEQCINETSRLHTFTFELSRRSNRDYKIPGTDIIWKKGSTVKIPMYALHKDPKYYPEPEKFDPERFKNMKDIPKCTYLPFGGGPRYCIGKRLAMLQMKVALAGFLSKYSISLSEKTKLPLKKNRTSFFNDIEGGLWLKLTKKTN